MSTWSRRLLVIVTCLPSAAAAMGIDDDPLLFMGKIDQLEKRFGEEDPVAWDAKFWLGKDLDKLWLKTEGEAISGTVESTDMHLLYGRAIDAYWDVVVGLRADLRPEPERNWLAVGVIGLAPYYFETDANLYIGESGRIAARLEFEYELLFTQRLILSPEIETNIYSKDDIERGIGSGFSDIEFGLRLRYEIRREIAPYIGINWETTLGNTKDIAIDEGEHTSDTQLVVGVRAWF